jgi:quinol monooxygenase YgiN
MIHVLASIQVKAGSIKAFVEIFKANVSSVRAEKGCIEYVPVVDVSTDIPVQLIQPGVVTVIEKWESVEALKAHLSAPHMLAYKEAVKEMLVNVEVKILQDV